MGKNDSYSKQVWFIVGCICLAGCVSNNSLRYSAVSENNLYHLARVRKGMDQKEVLQIMHKPYKYETFQTCDDIYDVWFYVTKPTGLGQSRMVSQNLTPLTFKNGVLVGTGYNWYYFAMKEQAMELEAQHPSPPKPKSQSVEDKEFEKALRPPKKTSQKRRVASPKKEDKDGLEKALNAPKKEKLPPNVHIIGGNDISQNAPRVTFAIAQKDFSTVRHGMTAEEVEKKIGEPLDEEVYSMDDGTVYKVWFYPVKSRWNKRRIHHRPLTFKNDIVVGTTMDYYNHVREEAGEERIDCYTPKTERMVEDESDQNFNYW